MGHQMGDKGTQHLALGLEGTRWDRARWDTLGHTIWDTKFGTHNLEHQMGDKGTQHLTLGLEGTRWDTARWDTLGHIGTQN